MKKIGFKIREHTLQKVPYLLILGEQECQQQQVTVRALDGTDLGLMEITHFVEILQSRINNKS